MPLRSPLLKPTQSQQRSQDTPRVAAVKSRLLLLADSCNSPTCCGANHAQQSALPALRVLAELGGAMARASASLHSQLARTIPAAIAELLGRCADGSLMDSSRCANHLAMAAVEAAAGLLQEQPHVYGTGALQGSRALHSLPPALQAALQQGFVDKLKETS
ncbi:hypothetical protein WJX72_002961 [[Myrmecia] bisecta]|uniref:Uncharacterized protein n=1 Tax=[Myrmecia] bisecta TaxID=41462 RepID=A0AAW1R4M8_9CHLO